MSTKVLEMPPFPPWFLGLCAHLWVQRLEQGGNGFQIEGVVLPHFSREHLTSIDEDSSLLALGSDLKKKK